MAANFGVPFSWRSSFPFLLEILFTHSSGDPLSPFSWTSSFPIVSRSLYPFTEPCGCAPRCGPSAPSRATFDSGPPPRCADIRRNGPACTDRSGGAACRACTSGPASRTCSSGTNRAFLFSFCGSVHSFHSPPSARKKITPFHGETNRGVGEGLLTPAARPPARRPRAATAERWWRGRGGRTRRAARAAPRGQTSTTNSTRPGRRPSCTRW